MFARNALALFFSLCLCVGLLTGCDSELLGPSATVEDHGEGQPMTMSKASMSYENGVTRYDGVMGGTNLYAIFVPDEWNGDLVVYAHGFIDVASPLHLSDSDHIDDIGMRRERGFDVTEFEPGAPDLYLVVASPQVLQPAVSVESC